MPKLSLTLCVKCFTRMNVSGLSRESDLRYRANRSFCFSMPDNTKLPNRIILYPSSIVYQYSNSRHGFIDSNSEYYRRQALTEKKFEKYLHSFDIKEARVPGIILNLFSGRALFRATRLSFNATDLAWPFQGSAIGYCKKADV